MYGFVRINVRSLRSFFFGIMSFYFRASETIQVIEIHQFDKYICESLQRKREIDFDCGSCIKFINLIRKIEIERGREKLDEKRTKIKSIERKIVFKNRHLVIRILCT